MAEQGETELDVGLLARAVWRKAWLLLLLALLVAVATYFSLGTVEPVFTADARVLIEERESPLTRSREEAAAPAAQYDESAIQSQVEVFRSREVAERVIDRLDLTQRPDFDPAMHPSPLTRLLVLVGLRDHPVDDTIRQRIMEAYFDRLSVYPVGRSRVIGVEFEAGDPQLAAQVTNTVVEAFVGLQEEAKREAALAATDWLEGEIARLRSLVADAEQRIADYQREQGLYDVAGTGENQGNLSTQQLSDLNAELARARAARSEAEARASLIRSLIESGGSFDASPEVLESPLIQRLQEREVALRSEIADLSTTLLPAHPRLRALQRQLADLNAQIEAEAGKVLRSLDTAARVAAAREQSLEGSLTRAMGDASASNDQEIELRALEREAAAQRDLLETLLARYREASARTEAGYLPADARIISRAVPPQDPSFPRKGMMSVAAAFGTLLIGGSIVMLREFASGRVFRGPGADVLEAGRPGSESGEGAPITAPSGLSASAPGPVQTTSASTAVPAPLAVISPPAASGEPAEDDTEKASDAEPEPSSSAAADPGIEPREIATAPAEAGSPEDIDPSEETSAPGEPTIAAGAAAAAVAAAEARGDEAAGDGTTDDEPVVAAGMEEEEPESDLDPAAAITSLPAFAEGERPGTAALAEVLASPALRTMLFAGISGGQQTGEVALAASRAASRRNLRIIIVDIGVAPSKALGGFEEPGLGDLLAGESSFGEVIRRDEGTGVHVIPMGGPDRPTPHDRLALVIGALTHTYDKVVVVADALIDWPHDHFTPDCAAIVCASDTDDMLAEKAYETVVASGAHSALIVRFGGDDESDGSAVAVA